MKLKQSYKCLWVKKIIYDSQNIESNQSQEQLTCVEKNFYYFKIDRLERIA